MQILEECRNSYRRFLKYIRFYAAFGQKLELPYLWRTVIIFPVQDHYLHVRGTIIFCVLHYSLLSSPHTGSINNF
jgi:hypothetical protein